MDSSLSSSSRSRGRHACSVRWYRRRGMPGLVIARELWPDFAPVVTQLLPAHPAVGGPFDLNAALLWNRPLAADPFADLGRANSNRAG
jgi:hypothetical protein